MFFEKGVELRFTGFCTNSFDFFFDSAEINASESTSGSINVNICTCFLKIFLAKAKHY